MGTYDSYAPYVQGMQWVPIKEDPQTLSREQSTGYTFTLSASTQLYAARVYVADQDAATSPVGAIVDVYRRGEETKVGNIRSQIFPCDGGTLLDDARLFHGSTAQECLANMYDDSYVSIYTGQFVLSAGQAGIVMSFDTATNPIPANSRILGANLLLTVLAPGLLADPGDGITRAASERITYPVNVTNASIYPNALGAAVSRIGPAPAYSDYGVPTQRLPIGSHTALWHSVTFDQYNNGANDIRFPLSTTRLAKFDGSVASDYLRIRIMNFYEELFIYLNYAALEVFYCEENRVLSGSSLFLKTTGPQGYKTILLANPATAATGTVVPAGDYTITVRQMESGGSTPSINALRQIYQTPNTSGIQILEWVNGTTDAPTSSDFDVLPQISLWTSGGTLVSGAHTYGRQVQAPVGTAGALTPTQGIYPRGLSGSTDFPYARFYARRFGETSSTLTLRETPYSGGLPTWSISSVDFDALPEILDGWRQVDAEFDISPALNASLVSFEWTCDVNDGTTYWEILGALAYDSLGASTNSSLSASTYSGSTAAASWQHAPFSSADSGGDLVLLLAQEPPTPTDLAVAVSENPVSSYTPGCSGSPYVASAVQYHTITWTATATSLPSSGFGYYELQRSDTTDTDWNTIATLSSNDAAGFKDYESRVGVETSYRIRTVTNLGFKSPWSSTTASTLPSPGATFDAPSGARIVILTSNQDQDSGYCAAYAHAYDDSTISAYAFPEGGMVSYQQPYGRNYAIALHPSERAGASFDIPILLGRATPETAVLPGFDALRDIAWATLPYVCVRDEIGNRYFASIAVDQGVVDRYHAIYMASIKVREVAQTPSEVSL